VKVDTIIRDARRTLEQIVKALAHGLTARDNLSGSGSEEGNLLVSTGPNTPPEWKASSDVTVTASPPFRPLDANDLETGVVPEGRLQGHYGGITGVGVLDDLKVSSVWMHDQTIRRDTTVPEGWGSPLVGPIDVATGVAFDIAGTVRIL
jgi:hypothetical protein